MGEVGGRKVPTNCPEADSQFSLATARPCAFPASRAMVLFSA